MTLLMPWLIISKEANNNSVTLILLSEETTEGQLQTPAIETILGETTHRAITTTRRATTPTATSRSASSAIFPTTVRWTARRELLPTSPAWTPVVARSGPRSMPLQTTKTSSWLLQSNLCRIFNSELDGTPTSSSLCHSATNYESVFHLHCNL